MKTYTIAVDGGHGPKTPGKATPKIPELGRIIHEAEFNHPTALFLRDALKRCGQNVIVTFDPKIDTPLPDRTNAANKGKADAFVSIHFDANTGKFQSDGKGANGVSVYHYPGSTKSQQLAKVVNEELIKGTPQTNRGVKDANFYVIHKTNCPAILCECGFMDFKREALLMLNVAFQKETAEDIARGLSRYLGFAYVAPTTKTTTATKTATKPTESIKVDTTKGVGIGKITKATILRKVPAYQEGSQIRDLKVGESYYVYKIEGAFYNLGSGYVSKEHMSFTPHPKKDEPKVDSPTPVKSAEVTPVSDLPILGKQKATIAQMIKFVQAQNPSFDSEIAVQYYMMGEKYGIRGDVALCQAIIETSWFKFGNGSAVLAEHHNFCGLGVVKKGVIGACFDSIQKGVTAHLQHLYAYATTAALPNGEVVVDPRFKYVKRGIADTFVGLNNKWAMNDQYGQHILRLFFQLINV